MTPNAGLSVQHYEQLHQLWQHKQAELAQALTELQNEDTRNELKITTNEQTALVDWLDTHFSSLMQEHAQQTELGVAVCASLWHKQLVELIFPTLVTLRWQYQLVPQFGANDILLDIEPNGRITTLSIPNSAVQSDNHQQLDEALTQLINSIAELLEPIFAEQKVNARRFWGNLSNALVQGFTRLSEQGAMDKDVSAALNAWLAVILGRNALVTATTVDENGQYFLYVRRQVCCLKYKLNKARMCKTCNLFALDEQEAFYRNKFITS